MQAQGQINFNAIGDAFNIVAKQWQPFVVAGLVTAVSMGVVIAIFWFLIFAAAMTGGEALGGIMMLAMMGLMTVAIMVVSAVFQAGLTYMALKAARGEKVEVGDVFYGLKNPVPYLIGGFLFGLCVGIGSMFCYIPGIILGGLLMFLMPFMVDRGMAPMDAFKASLDTLKPQWLMASLFFLVAYIVGGLGAIACYVGMFFTYPVMFVSIALAYRQVTGGGVDPVPPTAPVS